MSTPLVQPYLIFSGHLEAALEFYRTALNAKIEEVMHFRDCPDPLPPDMQTPELQGKIMHASFRVGDTLLMASDGCGPAETFSGFSLSFAVATEAEADRAFTALADGGTVTMPLAKTFWSPRFGMVTDRFGVSWMVNVIP